MGEDRQWLKKNVLLVTRYEMHNKCDINVTRVQVYGLSREVYTILVNKNMASSRLAVHSMYKQRY